MLTLSTNAFNVCSEEEGKRKKKTEKLIAVYGVL